MSERLSPDVEDLHALVDGQLAPEARRRVEARVAADPAAQRQVADYAAMRDGLRALYGPVAAEPIPRRLLTGQRTGRWHRPLAAAAAAMALLLAGGFAGVQLERARPGFAGTPSLVREAAVAYAVYTPEVRHPVEVPGEQEEHLVGWLTKRIGAPVRAPKLDGLGFSLVGGRLLAGGDGPGALLMYEDAEGRRVILYACRNEEDSRATAFRFSREQGVSVFHWVEGPLSYALAGEVDRAALLAIAEAVYRQITV